MLGLLWYSPRQTNRKDMFMPNGVVVAICIASEAGAPMQYVHKIEAIAGQGLLGDRYTIGAGSFNKKTGIGNRQVTLMNTRFFRRKRFRVSRKQTKSLCV